MSVAISPDRVPALTVFRTYRGRENGTAVVIAPGGAYSEVSLNLEGRQVADWFTARGITAFVLTYRVGPGNLYPIPLDDAKRALRLIRSQAKEYGFLPNRLGFVGFSAGGHLAAMVGATFDEGDLSARDPIDRYSDRPDFLILAYPWLNAMQPNDRGMITYCSVLETIPADRCRAYEKQYSPTLHVTSKFPPTFIYTTADDEVVPVGASLDLFQALNKVGVSAELHIFRHGDHASGLGSGQRTLDMWPSLLEEWLREQRFLSPEK
jgi:acetyl esterase/lipase